MIKTMTTHGNSLALVVDKPILDLLGIQKDTPLEISTNGRALIITPAGPASSAHMDAFLKAKTKAEKKLAPALKRLAE
jgi:antitoxin component of MazEF toxin-antitoxin module